MPYQVYWQDKARSIIHCEAHGCWDWPQYHEALDQIVELARSVAHEVSVVSIRMPNSQRPRGFGLPHYQRSTRIMPANVRRLILVTGNESDTTLATRWLATLARHLLKHITIATNLKEAHALIVEDRASLPNTVSEPGA